MCPQNVFAYLLLLARTQLEPPSQHVCVSIELDRHLGGLIGLAGQAVDHE